MSRNYTPNLGLLTVSPDEPLTTGDLERLFGSNLTAIDTSIHAVHDLALSLADAGHTPVQPVTLNGNELKVHIENASTMFDIPALLSDKPAKTPVRITGFTMALNSVADLLEFYDLLNTFYGIAADGSGLTKAQMHGTIRLALPPSSGINLDGPLTVTGAQMASWAAQYPSITVIPERIQNKVYYKSYDGSELLYTETLSTETIYDDGTADYPDAAYFAVPAKTSSDPQKMYSFRGWSTSSNSATADAVLTEVSQDLTVYAAYAYVTDTAPTLNMTDYSTAEGPPATATVTSFGAYSKITSLSALDANGNTITASPGGGILSVSVSDNVTTVSVTPDSAFFNASGWALNFSDQYGSCARSVPFNLRNLPVVTVTKKSSGSGDAAELTLENWGAYPNLNGYTCTDKES